MAENRQSNLRSSPLRSDGLVKSLKRRFSVIPAQAGIQYFHVVRILWIPVFTGMTTFYDFTKFYKKYLLNTAQLCWADENRFAESDKAWIQRNKHMV